MGSPFTDHLCSTNFSWNPHTRARASNSRLSIPRISRRRISRGAISKSQLSKTRFESFESDDFLCTTELLSDGPRVTREFIVRLFGKQEASLRSKIGENCESLRKGCSFFFFFSPFRKARPSWWDVARFTSSFIRIPFYFILFDFERERENKSDVHIIDIFLYHCLSISLSKSNYKNYTAYTKVVQTIRTSVCNICWDSLYKSIQYVYSPKIIHLELVFRNREEIGCTCERSATSSSWIFSPSEAGSWKRLTRDSFIALEHGNVYVNNVVRRFWTREREREEGKNREREREKINDWTLDR